ncbi:hypothetical protein LJC49_04590 [Ruminococcaceae bacterium OttesenSCG-928-I18]|nr:hypothetical protein [Ruminococcaceae bacterium OttesenSCG-928-I18]
MCDFCRESNADKTWDAGGSHEFRISEGGLYYYDEKYGWEGIAVNFCPMCGQSLRGENDGE